MLSRMRKMIVSARISAGDVAAAPRPDAGHVRAERKHKAISPPAAFLAAAGDNKISALPFSARTGDFASRQAAPAHCSIGHAQYRQRGHAVAYIVIKEANVITTCHARRARRAAIATATSRATAFSIGRAYAARLYRFSDVMIDAGRHARRQAHESGIVFSRLFPALPASPR